MADIFKPTYHSDIPATARLFTKKGKRYARFTMKTGRVVEGEILPNGRCRLTTEEYYARIRQRDGKVRRVPLGVTDPESARQLRAKLQLHADHGKAGLIDPYAQHYRKLLIGNRKELARCSHDRDRYGRITRHATEKWAEAVLAATEGSHLGDYAAHLLDGERTTKHVMDEVQRIRKLAIHCGFRVLDDLDESAIDKYLAGLVRSGRSYRTRNKALKAMRAFVRWLIRTDRLERGPFRDLRLLNVDADPRTQHRRRALSTTEFAALLVATENGPKVQGMMGYERSMLYLLAAWTGLRRKELSDLLVRHLSLDSDPAYVDLPAASTKARRDEKPIPLHPVVAEKFRAWLLSRGARPSDCVFGLLTESGKLRTTSLMMQKDCEAAGLPYVGDLGVADFHSHRVAFVTHLCRTADFSTAVDLSRHSDPRLTAKVYDRVRLEDRAAAINGLPLAHSTLETATTS